MLAKITSFLKLVFPKALDPQNLDNTDKCKICKILNFATRINAIKVTD